MVVSCMCWFAICRCDRFPDLPGCAYQFLLFFIWAWCATSLVLQSPSFPDRPLAPKWQ